jgi:hypothetical protein
MTNLEALSAAGGLSGMIGLLGAAVGYGRLQQRLIAVERDVERVADLGEKVSRIDERTRNTDENVKDLKGALADLTSALLNGGMSHLHRAAAARRTPG